MKKTTLSEQDKTRVLAACVALPPINRPQRIPNYLRAVMATVLDFYMQATVAIGAQNYFRDHVQAQYGIDSHARLMDVLSGYPDTQGGNTQAARFLWNNDHWKRMRLLRSLLRHFESIGVTDMPTLQAWAQQANFERDFKGKVPGLGLAVFQWLLIRCGVPTVKPDVWVFRFVERILGWRPSDRATVALFNEIAPLIESSLSRLDATIWRFERMGLGNHDLPALRVVFWQQLSRQLGLRIAGHPLLGRDTWAVELGDIAHLRYEQGGLRLASGCFAPEGTGTDRPAEIRVAQSSWQDGLELRLTVLHDRFLSDGIWQSMQTALDQAGWTCSNEEAFVASRELGLNLLMPPTTTLVILQARIAEAADQVILALCSYCDALAASAGTDASSP